MLTFDPELKSVIKVTHGSIAGTAEFNKDIRHIILYHVVQADYHIHCPLFTVVKMAQALLQLQLGWVGRIDLHHFRLNVLKIIEMLEKECLSPLFENIHRQLTLILGRLILL